MFELSNILLLGELGGKIEKEHFMDWIVSAIGGGFIDEFLFKVNNDCGFDDN